ncbi:hypothetical protein E1301_Tti011576 [Triplophysa tibetana]|uniref:Uncharacterized protein n=1 Tax=Triplophysa tibetana TaxID=1572043 RepID=A0A5A9PHJ4_9TELE|nr:hypothetical protein E1301_Tti011576 [Triplophysa tibetana]
MPRRGMAPVQGQKQTLLLYDDRCCESLASEAAKRVIRGQVLDGVSPTRSRTILLADIRPVPGAWSGLWERPLTNLVNYAAGLRPRPAKGNWKARRYNRNEEVFSQPSVSQAQTSVSVWNRALHLLLERMLTVDKQKNSRRNKMSSLTCGGEISYLNLKKEHLRGGFEKKWRK